MENITWSENIEFTCQFEISLHTEMFKIIFLLTFSITVSTAVDYCDREALECTKGDHIGCGSTYNFDPQTCHIWPGVQRINLLQAEKNQIVREHNFHRDQSAKGKIY